ncbi:hypothetical protein TNCV_1444861 [Trichonephila clavipes]|nr:hypothetical protein TNCV_1444861 [Trichonephila clavipes]
MYRGYRDESESHKKVGSQMELLQPMVQINKEKQQKQQRINGLENISKKAESVYPKPSVERYLPQACPEEFSRR